MLSLDGSRLISALVDTAAWSTEDFLAFGFLIAAEV